MFGAEANQLKLVFMRSSIEVKLEFGNVGFVGEGKPENPKKNPRSKDENQQQTQFTYDAGSENRTRATLGRGERSHHCATPVPLEISCLNMPKLQIV